jgi:DNA-binding NarL/FixJ family response regulator
MKTRVVVADDHQLVRAGIITLLGNIPDVDVVGEAADGVETVKLVAELAPDILFLDLVMPGMSGIEVLTHINESQPEVRAIVLSMYNDEEHVLRALKLGAMGYMLKDVAHEELAQAIKAVNQNSTWLSSAVSKTVISSYLEGNGGNYNPAMLSSRQNQVLKMLAEGHSTRNISITLKLSTKTIDTYRMQIMDKLNIHDIPGLVRYAIRHGIIPL